MLNRSKIYSSSSNNQNVSLTLPITCQICLSRIKDPCVCPNLHAFCKCCIDLWLEKSKQCPTCRVDINQENPCRRVLGGIENSDEVDLLKPSDFSISSMRKARYLSLFEQYEDEIERLCKYIDSLNDEISKLKESSDEKNNQNCLKQSENDMILKTKLDQVQSNLDQTHKERDQLKEANKKLESENSILMQDIIRLKSTLSEKNSQTSKYTIAALETKIESYEKEIKQLQKALDKSDKYIAELEIKQNITPSSSKPTVNKMIESTISFENVSKSVKFSDKIDMFQLSETNVISNDENSSVLSAKKINIIPKDNFYGSPSKTPNKTPNKMTPSKALANSETINKISSFSDKLKMMNSNSNNFCLELSSSLQSNPSNSLTTDQQLLLSNNERLPVATSNSCLASNWFSPMKRLRIEESVTENVLTQMNTSNNANFNPSNESANQINSDQSFHLLLSDSTNYSQNISNIPSTNYFNHNLSSFNFISNQTNIDLFQPYQLGQFNQSVIDQSNGALSGSKNS